MNVGSVLKAKNKEYKQQYRSLQGKTQNTNQEKIQRQNVCRSKTDFFVKIIYSEMKVYYNRTFSLLKEKNYIFK